MIADRYSFNKRKKKRPHTSEIGELEPVPAHLHPTDPAAFIEVDKEFLARGRDQVFHIPLLETQERRACSRVAQDLEEGNQAADSNIRPNG